LGHRGYEDTVTFTDKIAHATKGSFQISTDGFKAYQEALVMSLAQQKVHFAQLVKSIALIQWTKPGTRQRNALALARKAIWGNPDMDKVARRGSNATTLASEWKTRFTRLTNAFSKALGQLPGSPRALLRVL
jgi:hypothetical protein